MSLDALYQLIDRADAMPYNKAASQLWAQAVVMAEEVAEKTGSYTELVYCLLELQNSYYSGGEVTRQLAPFLKLQKLYQEHPEEFVEGLLHSYAWSHRYAFYVMRAVPEVPISSIRTLLDQSHELYKRMGDSRRALFQEEYRLAKMQGDTQLMEEMHIKWTNAEDTELSNCAGCDPEAHAKYYFDQKRWEEGIAVAEEALCSEEATCKNQPHSLLTEMLNPYIQVGSYDRAWQSHLRAYRKIKSDPVFLDMLPGHMEAMVALAQTGREHCRTVAKDLLIRHLPWWTSVEGPLSLLHLATAAAQVCAALPEDETLRAVFPGAELPWTSAPTLENPTAAAAYQWCVDIARDLAERFDARPGLTNPSQVATLEKVLSAQPIPRQVDGIVDVSGLFLNASLSEELQGDSEADEDAYAYPDLTEALHGPFITWDAERLLEEHKKIGGKFSSFLSLAIDKGATAPEEPTETHCPFHADLDHAENVMATGAIPEACEVADEVLRRPVEIQADPVGVRLRGLEILAEGAVKAGYPEESIAIQRLRINTAAAAGLRGELVKAATETTRALQRVRRTTEAGNVAQNALLFAENISQVPQRTPLVSALQELYTKALVAEEDFYSAAQATLEQLRFAGDVEAKINLYADAADLFQKSQHFDEAQRSLREAIALADSTDIRPLKTRVRNHLSYVLAFQPWYISDEDVAKIQTLEAERREIIGEEEPVLIAECFAREAFLMAVAERPDLVEKPMRQAEEIFITHNVVSDRLEMYIDIARALHGNDGSELGRTALEAAKPLLENSTTISYSVRRRANEILAVYAEDENDNDSESGEDS